MDVVLLFALVLLFVAVVLIVVMAARLLPAWASTVTVTASPDVSRVRLEFKEKASSRLAELGARLREKYGHLLPSSLKEERWQDSALQRKFVQAGYRSAAASSLLLGAMVSCAALGLAAGASLATVFVANIQWAGIVLAATAGMMMGLALPFVLLEMRIRQRRQQLLDHFPDALDLIRICLEAGLGLDASIQRVGREFQQAAPALFDEFHVLSLELRAGAGRTQALHNLSQRTGLAEIRSWVTMILQSEKFGTGIAEAVKIHSDQLRMTRKLNAEQRAATLSTKLLFPLVFCIFPALLLVLLGPAVITVKQHLGQSVERTN